MRVTKQKKKKKIQVIDLLDTKLKLHLTMWGEQQQSDGRVQMQSE